MRFNKNSYAGADIKLSGRSRWLAIRLDFLGGIMVFIVRTIIPAALSASERAFQVAMLAVSNASGINPAEIGLILTYTSMCSANEGNADWH